MASKLSNEELANLSVTLPRELFDKAVGSVQIRASAKTKTILKVLKARHSCGSEDEVIQLLFSAYVRENGNARDYAIKALESWHKEHSNAFPSHINIYWAFILRMLTSDTPAQAYVYGTKMIKALAEASEVKENGT